MEERNEGSSDACRPQRDKAVGVAQDALRCGLRSSRGEAARFVWGREAAALACEQAWVVPNPYPDQLYILFIIHLPLTLWYQARNKYIDEQVSVCYCSPPSSDLRTVMKKLPRITNSPSCRQLIKPIPRNRSFSQTAIGMAAKVKFAEGSDEAVLTKALDGLTSGTPRWSLTSNGQGIERSFKFKTFAKTWVSCLRPPPPFPIRDDRVCLCRC